MLLLFLPKLSGYYKHAMYVVMKPFITDDPYIVWVERLLE